MVQPPGYPAEKPMSLSELRDFSTKVIPDYIKSSSTSRAKYNEERKNSITMQLWYYGLSDKKECKSGGYLPALNKDLKEALKAGKV